MQLLYDWVLRHSEAPSFGVKFQTPQGLGIWLRFGGKAMSDHLILGAEVSVRKVQISSRHSLGLGEGQGFGGFEGLDDLSVSLRATGGSVFSLLAGLVSASALQGISWRPSGGQILSPSARQVLLGLVGWHNILYQVLLALGYYHNCEHRPLSPAPCLPLVQSPLSVWSLFVLLLVGVNRVRLWQAQSQGEIGLGTGWPVLGSALACHTHPSRA